VPHHRLAMKKPVVVVADDEETVRTVIMHMVGGLGCEVLPARDGLEALEIARRCPLGGAVDLVISDVDMPRLRGPELCDFLEHEQPGVPVILMTGDQRGVGEHHASLPLLLKPFGAVALATAVREALERAPCGRRPPAVT
jgi:CheY-like chemotaxis protein